jgi:hypothetical protein
MSGAPLSVHHGASLRLWVETKLGFKMVKWLKSIERGMGKTPHSIRAVPGLSSYMVLVCGLLARVAPRGNDTAISPKDTLNLWQQ